MKKFAIVLALVAFAVVPAMANASVLLLEQFSYPNGNLVGNGGWANHSGTGFFIQVVDGEAVLLQGSGSREDANVPFLVAPGATDKTYAAMLVTVPEATTLGAGDYFAHFRSATFAFPARIYIAAPQSGGDFSFGLSATSTGTSPIVYWGGAGVFGQTYTIVFAYDAANGSTQMWIDPVTEASPSITSTGGPVGDLINTFALRQGTGSVSTQVIGGILVGSTFADVVGGTVATENSSFGNVKALFR